MHNFNTFKEVYTGLQEQARILEEKGHEGTAHDGPQKRDPEQDLGGPKPPPFGLGRKERKKDKKYGQESGVIPVGGAKLDKGDEEPSGGRKVYVHALKELYHLGEHEKDPEAQGKGHHGKEKGGVDQGPFGV